MTTRTGTPFWGALARSLGRLVRVLAEAERELAELGLVALPRDSQA
jgi:hypothetical protein